MSWYVVSVQVRTVDKFKTIEQTKGVLLLENWLGCQFFFQNGKSQTKKTDR
jgi:hypothetical protein